MPFGSLIIARIDIWSAACLDDISGSASVALACGHRFHAACLAQMAGVVGTAATTSRRGTLTACPNCRKISRVAPLTPLVAAFGVGDRVHAMWGHKWFPGVVDEVVDGGRAYEIAWDDGDLGETTASRVRLDAQAPIRPATTNDPAEAAAAAAAATRPRPGREAVGWRVCVWWPDDAAWYAGSVVSYDGARHAIKYDDGDEEALDLSREKHEFVAARSSLATP